jgi:uncharacterized protein with NRDE domain
MCTVTYVPVGDKIFLTSSRDERITRATALPPVVSEYRGKKLLYPTDPKSGGSWIGVNENGHAAVLLNGAFSNHAPAPAYRMSRGRIFLDIISDDQPQVQFENIVLSGIEPFTLILLMREQVLDLRWDGIQKHLTPLNKSIPHIWSSATLYDAAATKERQNWFNDFLMNLAKPSEHEILQFHLSGGDENPRHSLVMQRDGVYATASVTRLTITPASACMYYRDLRDNRTSETQLDLVEFHQQ